MREGAVLAWSGGKDSAYALEVVRANAALEVRALLTTVTDAYDRVSVHGVRRSLLHRQADAVGLPVIEVVLPAEANNTVYEDRMARAIRSLGDSVRVVVFGDLFLEDVRAYRERQMAALGKHPFFPLWGRPTPDLAREMIAAGYEATIVVVDLEHLDRRFAGRAFDAALLADLPAGVDPCGERGEFHTFVHRAPYFRAPIPIRSGEIVVRDDRFAFIDLLAGDGEP